MRVVVACLVGNDGEDPFTTLDDVERLFDSVRQDYRIFKIDKTKSLTPILRLPIVAEVMISTRTFFYFAFTYRYFFSKESGRAKFENDVLMT